MKEFDKVKHTDCTVEEIEEIMGDEVTACMTDLLAVFDKHRVVAGLAMFQLSGEKGSMISKGYPEEIIQMLEIGKTAMAHELKKEHN